MSSVGQKILESPGQKNKLVKLKKSISRNFFFEQFFAENNNYFIINGVVDIKNNALFEDFIWKTTENLNLGYFHQNFFFKISWIFEDTSTL